MNPTDEEITEALDDAEADGEELTAQQVVDRATR